MMSIVTGRRHPRDRDTWWRNGEVNDAISAFKMLRRNGKRRGYITTEKAIDRQRWRRL